MSDEINKDNFVCNTTDPDSNRLNLFAVNNMGFETIEQYKEWCSQFVLGPPVGNKMYTTEKLKSFGLVGLYRAKK